MADINSKIPTPATAAPKTPEAAKPTEEKKPTPEAPTPKAAEPPKPADPKTPAQAEKSTESKTPTEKTTDSKATPQTDKTAPKEAAPPKPKMEDTPKEAEKEKAVDVAISKVLGVFEMPPSEKDKLALPHPGKGETFYATLHPDYLKPSEYNKFSVDRDSDDFKELCKSIEQMGIIEPVFARPGKDGMLEILSGQRRHIAATEVGRSVPVIIKNIDDDDAKILVADGNIHREKITSYDLSRALRMKMEGTKHKAGRRRKDDPSAPDLNSDEVLAKEMGMTVAKLNRFIRLSEAIPEVCECVDDGSLSVSIASAISFLRPANQEKVMDLIGINLKPTTAQIERMKKLDKSGKLTDKAMRDIIADKDITPKKAPEPVKPDPAQATQGKDTTTPTKEPLPPNPTAPMGPGAIPASPDVSKGKEVEDDPFKGKQERPENLKIILTGDRLRKYFPDVEQTPREIEDSIYSALEERKQRQERAKDRAQQKDAIFGKKTPKAPSR